MCVELEGCCVAGWGVTDHAKSSLGLLNYKRVQNKHTNPIVGAHNPPESSGTPHASVAPGPAACQLRANVPRTARSGSSLRPAYSYTQRSRLYGAPRLIRSRKEGRDLLKLGEGEPLASHLPQGGVRALSTPTRAPRHAALKAGADAV